MSSTILQLDIQDTPQAWISLEQAARHYASEAVAWEQGDRPLATLRGGWNVARGAQSRIDVAPIIALCGASKVHLFEVVPAVSKARLLRRDRYTCAYCGGVFKERDLQCEHVLPASSRSCSMAGTSGRMCASGWWRGCRKARGCSNRTASCDVVCAKQPAW